MGIGEAGREIEALFPAQITQASKGMGSFINIYFHNSDKNSGHIWIYLCDWRLIESSTEVEISDSIDNNANIHDFFSGEMLLGIETIGPQVKLKLTGSKIVAMSANRQEYVDEDMFIIYVTGQAAVGYGPCTGPSDGYGWNIDDTPSPTK